MSNPRDKYDALAWTAIHALKPPLAEELPGLQNGTRPSTFAEVEQKMRKGYDWRHCWGEFLDEFYIFKRASFFAEEPSHSFTPRRRAFLAGATEYLCKRFGLEVPTWTEKTEYFLKDEWAPGNDTVSKSLRGEAAEEFARRNIFFRSRNLIRL
jgi:hypothetical protein